MLDNLAICCSYAKSCLILMRLEVAHSAEEAKAIIDEYCASAKRGYQINILTTEDIDKDIRSLLNAEERISYNPYQHGGFNEYMIYCAEE